MAITTNTTPLRLLVKILTPPMEDMKPTARCTTSTWHSSRASRYQDKLARRLLRTVALHPHHHRTTTLLHRRHLTITHRRHHQEAAPAATVP